MLLAVALVLSGSLPFLPDSLKLAVSEVRQTAAANAAAVPYWQNVYPTSNNYCGSGGSDDSNGYPVRHTCYVIPSLNSGACYPTYGCSASNPAGSNNCLRWGYGTIGIMDLYNPPYNQGNAAYIRQDGAGGTSGGTVNALSGAAVTLDWACQDYQGGPQADAHTENYCSASSPPTWSTGTLADSVSITGPGVAINTSNLVGSTVVNPTGTTGSVVNYSVACKLGGVTKGTMTLPVVIWNAPVSITASPQTVASGGSSLISYTASGVDAGSCKLTGPSGTVFQAPSAAWTQRPISAVAWRSIASSADGMKLIAANFFSGYTYTSDDRGASWTTRTATDRRNWVAVASSADGTKLFAAPNNHYIWGSTDGGATWTAPISSGWRVWTGLTSSADGTKLAATYNADPVYDGEGNLQGYTTGGIMTSSNGGSTWTARAVSGAPLFSGITSSSDGTKLAAVVSTDSSTGYIYTSADSGATWTTRTGAGSHRWRAISSSADGTKLVAGSSDNVYGWLSGLGYIYTSTDSGVTWTQRTEAGQHAWSGLASSADGTRLAASANDRRGYPYNQSLGYLYTSIDSGATWVQQDATASLWSAITSSSDGTKLAATDYINGVTIGAYIYTKITDFGNINGQYTPTNITSNQTYTFLCTIGGVNTSTSTTIATVSAPTATINAGAGDGVNRTVYSGGPYSITATYTPGSGDTLAATAINGSDQVNSVPCADVAPYNTSCWTQPDATKTYTFTPVAGTYTFYASQKTLAYTTYNNYKSVTLTVVDQCPNGQGTAGSCTSCNNGYVLQGGSCVVSAPPPTISFSANPSRVRKAVSTPVTFSWTVTNPPASCTISGPTGFTPLTINPANGVAGSQVATVTLSARSNFTLTCGAVSQQVTLNLVPNVQEI